MPASRCPSHSSLLLAVVLTCCCRARLLQAQTASSTTSTSAAEAVSDAHLPWERTRGVRCTTVDRPLFPGDAPEVVAVERHLGAGFGVGECKALCARGRCSTVTHVAGAGDCYTYEGICVQEPAEPNVVVYSRPVVTTPWQVALNSYCEGPATQHDVRTQQECKALCFAQPPCAAASVYPNTLSDDLHSCYTVHSACVLGVSLYGGEVHFNPAYLAAEGDEEGDVTEQSSEAATTWGASIGWECTASPPRNVTAPGGSGGDVVSELPGTVLNTTRGASQQECQQRCDEDSQCTAFTYNTDTGECTLVEGACNEVTSPDGEDVTTYYKPWGEVTSGGESSCEEGDWVGPVELSFSECKALCTASDGCIAVAMAPCYLLVSNCTIGGSDSAQLPGDTGLVVTVPGVEVNGGDSGGDGGSGNETDDDTTDADGLDSGDRGTGAETSGPLSTLVWVAVGFGILMMLALCVAFAFFLTDRRRAGYSPRSQKGDTIETRELNLENQDAGVDEHAVRVDNPPSFTPASPERGLASTNKEMVLQDETGSEGPMSPASPALAGGRDVESGRVVEPSSGAGRNVFSSDAASSKPSSEMSDTSDMGDLDDLLPSENDNPERLSMPRRS